MEIRPVKSYKKPGYAVKAALMAAAAAAVTGCTDPSAGGLLLTSEADLTGTVITTTEADAPEFTGTVITSAEVEPETSDTTDAAQVVYNVTTEPEPQLTGTIVVETVQNPITNDLSTVGLSPVPAEKEPVSPIKKVAGFLTGIISSVRGNDDEVLELAGDVPMPIDEYDIELEGETSIDEECDASLTECTTYQTIDDVEIGGIVAPPYDREDISAQTTLPPSEDDKPSDGSEV